MPRCPTFALVGALGTPARSSGLSSMRRRADRNGGTFQLTIPANGGTHLA